MSPPNSYGDASLATMASPGRMLSQVFCEAFLKFISLYIKGNGDSCNWLRARVISRNLKLEGIDKCLGGSVNMRKVQIYIKKHYKQKKLH